MLFGFVMHELLKKDLVMCFKKVLIRIFVFQNC